MSAMSITRQAINVLQLHNQTPEALLSDMSDHPNKVITFHDEHEHKWQFIARRRCRLFLLAKAPETGKYEDIYCSARL
jgi:hypothetical protein